MAKSATDKQEAPSFFIFNATAEDGFVIVSGDDAAGDILGYVKQGHYDEESSPTAMKALLADYAGQIKQMREGQSKKPVRRLNAHESISPLVTTTWSQGSTTADGGAYNLLTPVIDERHTLAGCVAISMAQVLNYHQWPMEACQEIPGYTTKTAGLTMEALPPVTFDWGNILCSYNGTETDEERMAVAQLALYCGQAAKTNYGLDESEAYGTDAALALRHYFNMSPNLRYVKASDFTPEEWDKIIYNELASSRPVIYFGFSGSGGHCFICDGYDGNEFYHINWGWGGDCDGYFKLSVLNPNGENSATTYSYSLNQHAIIGLHPKLKPDDFIPFTDDTAKAICIANWDSDEDGELSYEEASVVLSLDDAFTGNTEVKQFNELQYFRGLKSIGPKAFAGCTALTAVEMPPSINEIKDEAFAGCSNLLSLIIPEGVNVIESDAFIGCSNINRIYVKAGNNTFDSRENCHAIIETGTNSLVLGCQNTVIPQTVTNIGSNAFYGCTALTKIQIPENVVHIYNGAFEACTNLKEVTLPSTLYTIGERVFLDNVNLQKITLPQNLNRIGSLAFSGCTKMTTMIASNPEPATCGDDAFLDIHPTLYVPNGAKAAYQEAKEWSTLTIEELKENDYITCADTTFTKAQGGQLTIKLRNNDNVIGLQFRLTLPEGITIRETDEEYDITKSSRIANQTIYCTQQADGSYLILVMSMSMAPIAGHDGTIMQIGIVCDEGVEPGEYDASFSDISISTIDRGNIIGVLPLPFTSKIKVRKFDMGDVNGDNSINVSDVMQVVNYILGFEPQNFLREFADLDYNNRIDVTDVMRIVQLILNQSTGNPQPSEDEQPAEIAVAPTSADAFTVQLDDNRNLTAMQMTVQLPETCTLKDIRMREEGSNGHQAILSPLGHGRYQVVIYNLCGLPFRSGNALFDLITGGEPQEIAISDILFTDTEFKSIGCKASFTGTDGISETISGQGTADSPAYTISGQKAGSHYQGIILQNGKKHIRK